LEFESGFVAEMIEIAPPTRQQIIGNNDGITFRQQRVAEMRSQESGTAGDQRPLTHEWLAFLGGTAASTGTDSGIASGRPTL